MTAAEKAKELVDKYIEEMIESDAYFVNSGAKKCALIAVDQHLKGMSFTFGFIGYASLKFWNEVKQEIEKL